MGHWVDYYDYIDGRDCWSFNPDGTPNGWLRYLDGYAFKSDPFGDHAPVVGEYYDRERRKTVYYVEDFSIGHFARVEADTLLKLEHKWNNRAYQNTYFENHPQYRVCPFEDIVNEVPVRTGNKHPESAARILRGRYQIVIPKFSYLYIDGDKNGGYYLGAWSTEGRKSDDRDRWNTRLNIHPFYEPRDLKWFSREQYL